MRASVRVEIEHPDWVPSIVSHLARIMHADAHRQQEGTDTMELLHRLTCDPRMKRVWSELLRRKRSNYSPTEAFFHTARAAPAVLWSQDARSLRRRVDELRRLSGPQASQVRQTDSWALLAEFADTQFLFAADVPRKTISLQERALSFLFKEPFMLARILPQVMSRADAQKARSGYLKMAERLIADSAKKPHGASDLLAAAGVYMEMADNAAPSDGSSLLVERERGDSRVKGFVRALASTIKEMFGAPLFGTVATLANVALDRRDLTAGRVRKLLGN